MLYKLSYQGSPVKIWRDSAKRKIKVIESEGGWVIYPAATSFPGILLLSLKLSRTLWDSWAQSPFFVPLFLFVGNSLQPPWASLSSKGQIWTILIREGRGCREREEQSRNNNATLGRVLVPPQGKHLKISFVLFIELKTPINGRCQHSIPENLDKLIRRPTEGRLKECRPWSLSATPPLKFQ